MRKIFIILKEESLNSQNKLLLTFRIIFFKWYTLLFLFVFISMSNKFLDLLIESGIDANVIAAELITNRLIRSVQNKYDRPDFNEEKLEPYEIYTIRKALEKNKSPLIGISFQNIKRQFYSDELYEERNGTSFIDPFYWTDIPTDNLKKYSKLAKAERKKKKNNHF